MITEKMPRDYALGKRAYESWFGNENQVGFQELNHDYQMRWVTVAREVLQEAQRLKRNGPVEFDDREKAALVELNPKIWVSEPKSFKPKKKAKSKAPFAWKTAPNKKWRELTPVERRARQREYYEATKNKG